MKKILPTVVITGLLLAGCAGTPTAPSTPRLSVEESCTFLNGDTFVPSGTPQEQNEQIAQHFQEVADKVDAEISDPIQKMADIMKQVSSTPLGGKTAEQSTQLAEQTNRIGTFCK